MEPKWGKERKDSFIFQYLCINIYYKEHYISTVTIYISNRPKVDEFQCEIYNYGLRDLKTSGILNPRKPFLKLFLKSLAPPEYQGSLNDITTKPIGGGANPTFASMIRFTAMMPSDDIFCPSLQCAVYDSILFGLSQPLIGNLFFPLALVYKVQRAIRKNEQEFEKWLWSVLNNEKSIMQEQPSETSFSNILGTEAPSSRVEPIVI